MRIVTALAALLFLACPVLGRAAVPAASCPDILMGDSLAVGMGPYARAAGFEVLARTGIGLSWLRQQNPRCARRVVVVIGTNDLRGIDPYSAEAYPARLAAIMARWQTQEITWATPGCFPYDESLERGSEALDRVLAREPLVRVGGQREYMRVHSGRLARCSYISGDGIHPTGAGYRAWWASLSQAIGPAPEGETYREARAVPEIYARPAARSARYARSDPHVRSARLAGSTRPGSTRTGASAQQARSARPAHSVQVARSDRPGRPVQLTRQDRQGRSTQVVRSDRQVRPAQAARTGRPAQPVQQARSDRTRSAQQARAPQQGRPAPHARAQDVRQARPSAPARMVAVNPTRRT
jgi:lysophospholipase L1-like esterase